MILKDIWAGTSSWLRSRRFSIVRSSTPQVDSEGLITEVIDSAQPSSCTAERIEPRSDRVVVKAVQPPDRHESLEKLQEGFDRLVGQLQAIHGHLDRQLTQHEDLANAINQLPQLLGHLPCILESQQKLTEQLLEQLKLADAKGERFMDAVERIPAETARQTNALVNIDHQLAAAADADVQMVQSLNKFNDALGRLNHNTIKHTEGIAQMSRTFAAGDRYLKYIVSTLNRRLVWVFVIAVSVCVAVISALTGIIIYLQK